VARINIQENEGIYGSADRSVDNHRPELTDQEVFHNSHCCCQKRAKTRGASQSGSSIDVSQFLGWTELLHIVSESPRGWLLVYLARQSRDPSNQGWLLRKNLAGVSNTSINRLLRTPYTATVTASLRPSDQKPRHPVTCSACARGICRDFAC